MRLSGIIIPETLKGRKLRISDLKHKAWRDSLPKWSTAVLPKLAIEPANPRSNKRIALTCDPADAGRNWESLAVTANFRNYLYAWDLFKDRTPQDKKSLEESTPDELLLADQSVLSDAPLEPPSTSVNFPLVVWASNFKGDGDVSRGLMLKDKPGIWPVNNHEGGRYYAGQEVVVKYQPQEIFSEGWWIEAQEQTLAALDKRFSQMRSELAGDVIDILFHHWERQRNPQESEKAFITLSQICAYRNKAACHEQINSLWLAMRDIRAIRLTGEGIDQALFDMAIKTGRPTLWGTVGPPQADAGFIYWPGYFLAKAIKGEPTYFAPYMSKVWELDPYRDSTAKKLSRWLRREWRMNPEDYLREKGAAPTRFRQWEKILNEAGIDTEEYINSKNPARLKADVERAIKSLWNLEMIADFGPESYDPNDRLLLDRLPRKGAMRTWLKLRVCIDPAADVRDALANPAKRRAAYRELSAANKSSK